MERKIHSGMESSSLEAEIAKHPQKCSRCGSFGLLAIGELSIPVGRLDFRCLDHMEDPPHMEVIGLYWSPAEAFIEQRRDDNPMVSGAGRRQ